MVDYFFLYIFDLSIKNKQIMSLTKYSERNLNVILNFLLYAGLEKEYTQVAHDYIEEDHVDGEESKQAILERAYDSELIIEESYEADDVNETRPINYYADSENQLIYGASLNDEEVSIYRLTKPQEVIEIEHRDEILSYVLSKYTKEDKVYLRDIISHGKYVEKVSTFK